MKSAAKRSVVLVDEDPATSSVYAHGLMEAGFVVTTAGSATAVLSAIGYELPDVVVLDWQMPDMRGDELLELLARNRATRNVPVLFLSNVRRDDPQVAGSIVAGQTMGWLVKSTTSPQDLATLLLVALDGHVEPPL